MDVFLVIQFIFGELVGRIDAKLLPFVGMFFVLGYWLKRTRLPAWCPKIPTLLFIAGFAVFTVLSALMEQPDSALDAISILLYGLGNACFFVSVSVLAYDIKHARTKAKEKQRTATTAATGGGNG